MKRHTVEITFEAEEIATVIDEYATETLYRTPYDTYFVYLDARKSGDNAVLEIGAHPHGFSEAVARHRYPDLFKE
jgi:hypothetical protein